MTQLSTPLYTLGTIEAPLWQGNALDSSSCAWVVESESGWSSSPPVRPSEQDRTVGDGAWAGDGYYQARLITLTGRCVAPDQVSMLWAKAAAKAAIRPRGLVTLRVDELHLSRAVQGRLHDQVQIQDQGPIAFKWQWGMFVPDPRLYAVNSESLSCGLPGAGSEPGRTYPRTYPLTYTGIAGDSSQVIFTQSGDYDYTPALITVTGPVINPVILHDRSGSSLTFTLTLGYAQAMVIDLAAMSAVIGGTTSANQYLTAASAWWMLEPGDNVVRFRGEPGLGPDGLIGAPRMTLTAASAWS